MLYPNKEISNSNFSNKFLLEQNRDSQERQGTACTTTQNLATTSLLNKTSYFKHLKKVAGEPMVRIAKSSENPARQKLAQKSAGLLRRNTKNKLERDKSKQSKARGLSSGFSIEQMIKELGNQDSMANTKIIDLVNARIGSRTAWINDEISSQLQATQDYIPIQEFEKF